MACILVFLLSTHCPTGILMQRDDYILEWILAHKQSKKLKTYIEKVSELILKGQMRLRQLVWMDLAEIVVKNTEIASLWAQDEQWQKACSNFLGGINNRYPKSKWLQFIKRTNWILPRIIKGTPISGAPTFYTDASKSGKARYKSEKVR